MSKQVKSVRAITSIALGSGLALVGSHIYRQWSAISRVSPELITPNLWLPLNITSRAGLVIARRMITRTTVPLPEVDVRRVVITGGQDAYLYRPVGAVPSGALLWIHGGGTIAGQPEGDHDLASKIARDAGVYVLSVRYRLAPEHPFPAAFDDCFAGLEWLHRQSEELGIDPDRIAVGGASAGGGLAAVVAQRALDEGLMLAFQALVYPMLDDRTARRRAPEGRGSLSWTARSNRYAWTAYLGHPPQPQEERPYVAASRRSDLHGLAPAWIGVGDVDLFYDEDVEYSRRLSEADVPVELHIEPGMYHGADVALAATIPSMEQFQHRMIAALRGAIGS